MEQAALRKMSQMPAVQQAEVEGGRWTGGQGYICFEMKASEDHSVVF